MKFLSTNKYYYTTVALFIVLGGILLSFYFYPKKFDKPEWAQK